MGLHCPKCGSSRVRRGYELPALPLRLIGIHSLLCDSCNLSYRGFAIPGTVPTHAKKKYRSYRREQGHSEIEEKESVYADVAHDEGVKVLDAFSFGWYYLKLQFKVLFGLHHTTRPLGLKYRWRNWQHWQRGKHQ